VPVFECYPCTKHVSRLGNLPTIKDRQHFSFYSPPDISELSTSPHSPASASTSWRACNECVKLPEQMDHLPKSVMSGFFDRRPNVYKDADCFLFPAQRNNRVQHTWLQHSRQSSEFLYFILRSIHLPLWLSFEVEVFLGPSPS
jgi:hypothetical protein